LVMVCLTRRAHPGVNRISSVFRSGDRPGSIRQLARPRAVGAHRTVVRQVGRAWVTVLPTGGARRGSGTAWRPGIPGCPRQHGEQIHQWALGAGCGPRRSTPGATADRWRAEHRSRSRRASALPDLSVRPNGPGSLGRQLVQLLVLQGVRPAPPIEGEGLQAAPARPSSCLGTLHLRILGSPLSTGLDLAV
jgi:hypothetical protein